MTSDRHPMFGDDPDRDALDPSASGDTAGWTFDGIDPRLAGGLTNAFRAQADDFEPTRDSYRRLAEAVNDADRGPTVRWLRPLAVAAAVLATVGLGASLLSLENDTQRLGTEPGSGEVAVDGENPGDAAAVGDGADTGTGGGSDPVAVDGSGQDTSATAPADGEAPVVATVDAPSSATVGPVRTTQLDAARAFLGLLRQPYGAPEIVDGRMVVRSYREGGVPATDGPIVATLSLASVDGGFAVVEAITETVVIEEVSEGDLSSGRLSVGGAGSGFESVVDVRVMSALDNRVLAVGSARAGNFGQSASFTTELPVVGAEHGWIVVSGGGGADGVIEPFAARPVSYRAGNDDADYTVVRIPADDPDGGLHLRVEPSTAGRSQGVIAPGAGGVRRTDRYPVLVGTELWWSVTADGKEGWVNSRFVASVEPVTEAQLIDLVQRLGAGGAPFRPSADFPVTRRAKVAIGPLGRPTVIDPEMLLSTDGWTVTRSLPASEPAGGEIEAGLVDLYQMDRWAGATIQVGADYASADDAAAARRYFGDLPMVAITPESSDSSGPRTFVFAESTPDGPEIIGLLVE